MKCSYHPGYKIPLPTPDATGTALQTTKAELLKDRLLAEAILEVTDLMTPELPDAETLALIHSDQYLYKLQTSGLSLQEQRLIGIPWSETLYLRSMLATGGTLLAARTALTTGISANLAGGSHHAFADHGEGFCVLNDVAIAVAKLRRDGMIRRALIVDLDVHQGNGTAAIFDNVDDVYTFSMHGEHNYPAVKMRSNLDVPLRNGTGDDEYLDIMRRHLPRALDCAAADIVFYLAGVDVAAGDRFGKLALTDAGIRMREREVIAAVRSEQLPLAIVLAGGYAPTRERTADLHMHVFREAAAVEHQV